MDDVRFVNAVEFGPLRVALQAIAKDRRIKYDWVWENRKQIFSHLRACRERPRERSWTTGKSGFVWLIVLFGQ